MAELKPYQIPLRINFVSPLNYLKKEKLRNIKFDTFAVLYRIILLNCVLVGIVLSKSKRKECTFSWQTDGFYYRYKDSNLKLQNMSFFNCVTKDTGEKKKLNMKSTYQYYNSDA